MASWKTRNYIKYNKSIYRKGIAITNFKTEQGPGWFNEVGCWITVQAYHQYGVGSRPAL